MRTLFITLVALTTLVLLPLLVTAQTTTTRPVIARPAPAAQLNTFEIDGVHSSVVFMIKHLGVGDFYGRFNEISGEFAWDDSSPAAGSINVTIAAESVDTANTQRDNHLRSPDFFNAREFATVTFRSTTIQQLGDAFEVTGDLTLHGVTKPVTAELVWNGSGDKGQRFGYRGGLAAEFTIKRSEFGMDTYIEEGMLSDEVKLIVGLSGVRK